MTREEAINVMNVIIHMLEPQYDNDRVEEAVDMAIQALEQEPCSNCIEFKRYAKQMGFSIEQEPILDKIRAEICDIACYVNGEMMIEVVNLEKVLEIIDKYKESEGKK